MEKSEKYTPNDFQKLYNNLSLMDRLSIDSTIQMSFFLFQRMSQMIMTQQNQKKQDKKDW